AVLPKGEPALGILSFALAGLGCSALLPLTIQLRPGRDDDDRRLGGRRHDRRVPSGIRHRRLRRRSPAGQGRVRSERGLRRYGSRRAGHGGARRRRRPSPECNRSSIARTVESPISHGGMTVSVKGKVAVVTGGNSGIGMAIVLELARQGANLVIDYIAHPEATEGLEREVAALGDRVVGVEGGVRDVATRDPR